MPEGFFSSSRVFLLRSLCLALRALSSGIFLPASSAGVALLLEDEARDTSIDSRVLVSLVRGWSVETRLKPCLDRLVLDRLGPSGAPLSSSIGISTVVSPAIWGARPVPTMPSAFFTSKNFLSVCCGVISSLSTGAVAEGTGSDLCWLEWLCRRKARC